MPSNTDTQHLTLRLPRWIVKKLDDEAKKTLVSRTDVLRTILLRYLNGEFVTQNSLTPVNKSKLPTAKEVEAQIAADREAMKAAALAAWDADE